MTTPLPDLTENQLTALAQALDLLQRAFPDQTPLAIIKRQLLPRILGPLPAYSNLTDGYAINKVTLAAVGASAVCWGDDPETGERVVLVIDRKEIDAQGRHYYGLLGGYVNLDATRCVPCATCDPSRGEQPHEGAISEAAEESKDGHGRPLVRLTPDRVALVYGGVNYQVSPPAAYFVHTAQLTQREIMDLRAHINMLAQDKAYRARTLAHNENEVYGMHLFPLSEAQALRQSQFFYQTTWAILQKALEAIAPAPRAESRVTHSRQQWRFG